MESYLSGRSPDGEPSPSKESPPFSAFVEPTEPSAPAVDETVQTLHDEPGGPKVEVVSVEGRVTRVLVHLENGKILNLHCEY
ncbi:MAG: hypothetical protein CMI31_15505 [Opitutae bacterium]|nr:hypothetical protein [Opitutae bacterium]